MAEGAAPRRIGSRSQCVTHGDAGTRPAEMRRRRVRLSAFSSRLLSVLAVFPAADPIPYHAARQARPARAPAGLHYILSHPGYFDVERAAAPGTANKLGPHHTPRGAAKVTASAASDPFLSGCAGPDRAGKGGRSRDQNRHTMWHSAQDRRESGSGRPGIFG